MQYANILLALGGDGGNQVPKFFVTPAEVLILQAIHGDQAVTEVDILELDDLPEDTDEQRKFKEELEERDSNEELGRLREEYRHARVDDGNGSQRLVVSGLFPGAGAKVPESFTDIDTIPDEFYKAEDRKVPRKTAKKSTAKKAKKADDAKDKDADEEEPKSFE